jgi:hypothetical protein
MPKRHKETDWEPEVHQIFAPDSVHLERSKRCAALFSQGTPLCLYARQKHTFSEPDLSPPMDLGFPISLKDRRLDLFARMLYGSNPL